MGSSLPSRRTSYCNDFTIALRNAYLPLPWFVQGAQIPMQAVPSWLVVFFGFLGVALPVASTKAGATAMVKNLRVKKKTPGWIVAARNGSTTLQDPLRFTLLRVLE